MRPACLILLTLALALASASARTTAADAAVTGYPDSIAGLGDSITRAANIQFPPQDYPEASWSTGTDAAVQSIYSRILAVHPAISGNRFNDAVSGAQMDQLDTQATNAVSQGAELVTILMGANDVCTPTEASMTPIATFRSEFEAGMAILSAGLPDARIAVGTIPDIYNLWFILKDNSSATQIWNFFDICQSMLLNPTSTAPADVTRRANVRQRNIDFNTQLAEVCAEYVHCRFDNNAGFNTAFQPQHVSTLDYFHPALAGQALAANVAWTSSFDLTDNTAPSSTGSGSPIAGGISVTIGATDNVAVSGVEYKINGAAYQRYTGPVTLLDGSRIDWRAVDVNGNSEATKCLATPDVDADCVLDGADNCPAAANPGQENADGDSLGDACDPNDDNDMLSDTAETACGSSPASAASLPERVDGTFAGTDDDADTSIDEALPGGASGSDCDGDGYTGTAENNVFFPNAVSDQDPCGGTFNPPTTPAQGWAANITGGGLSANDVDIQDLSAFIAPTRRLNTSPGDGGYDVRWDLVPGTSGLGETINIADLTNLAIVAPPMLGGAQRAYNGPPCPWPP